MTSHDSHESGAGEPDLGGAWEETIQQLHYMYGPSFLNIQYSHRKLLSQEAFSGNPKHHC